MDRCGKSVCIVREQHAHSLLDILRSLRNTALLVNLYSFLVTWEDTHLS